MMTSGQSLTTVDDNLISSAIQVYRAKSGRPSMFTPEIAATIIERLAEGETLRAICKDPTMPSNPTVYDWMAHSPAFASAIAQARRVQATALVEEGQEILDTCDDSDKMAPVSKAKEQAAFRFRLAQAFDRDTYGDKVQNDVNIRGVMIQTSCTELNDLLNGG